ELAVRGAATIWSDCWGTSAVVTTPGGRAIITLICLRPGLQFRTVSRRRSLFMSHSERWHTVHGLMLGRRNMTSGKQRKVLLKQRRRDKARRTDPKARGPGLRDPPAGAVMADLSQLEHDNTYGPRPLFYVDRQFACIECGSEEVWTAADQKWWYEVAKGK